MRTKRDVKRRKRMWKIRKREKERKRCTSLEGGPLRLDSLQIVINNNKNLAAPTFFK